MIKWLFNGKLQIVIEPKEKWKFSHNIKGEYFDADTYKSHLSFGKITFFWNLPTEEEINEAIQMNEI